MRAAAMAFVFGSLAALGAQAQDFAQTQNVVSVSQFADVKPSDPHFQALRSLVERYGVAQGYKSGTQTTFNADAPLKRVEMTNLMATALSQMSELMVAMDARPEMLSKLSIMHGAKCKASAVAHSSVSQLIDVTPQSPWRGDLQQLVEKWNVQVANKDGVFGAGDDVTTADASACLKIFSQKPLFHRPEKLTRGGFAIMLNEALESFNEDLAAASAQ